MALWTFHKFGIHSIVYMEYRKDGVAFFASLSCVCMWPPYFGGRGERKGGCVSLSSMNADASSVKGMLCYHIFSTDARPS